MKTGVRSAERRGERGGDPPLRTRLVIFGRDGVLGDKVDGLVQAPEQWRPQPGSLEAIARIHHAGLRIAVATNQSAIARGRLDMSTLVRIHRRMTHLVEQAGGRVDAIAVCPHLPTGGCDCRKPAPGMIRDLLSRFDIDPSRAVVVGDSLDDVEAGRAVGCRVWIVRTGMGERALDSGHLPQGTVIVDDMTAVADRLLSGIADDAAEDAHAHAAAPAESVAGSDPTTRQRRG